MKKKYGLDNEDLELLKRCQLCEFLLTGFENAKAKTVKSEYGTAYVGHMLQIHLEGASEASALDT